MGVVMTDGRNGDALPPVPPFSGFFVVVDVVGKGVKSKMSPSSLIELIPPLSLSTFLVIVRSAIAYVSFLLVFLANGHLRLLPIADEVGGSCLTLYNVSAWEARILPVSPNRVVAAAAQNVVLDLLSAVPYMAHYGLPVIYPIALHLVRRTEAIPRFYQLIGWTMWLHYVVWYFVPTAPPWFYDAADARTAIAVAGGGGLTSMMTAVSAVPDHREGAAFTRLDHLTGGSFFYHMFAGNPVPFASFPSGHVAWPTCILLTLPPGAVRWRFSIYLVWVGWATMYASHHYLSDVVGAIGLVLVTNRLITWWNSRRNQATACTVTRNGVVANGTLPVSSSSSSLRHQQSAILLPV